MNKINVHNEFTYLPNQFWASEANKVERVRVNSLNPVDIFYLFYR